MGATHQPLELSPRVVWIPIQHAISAAAHRDVAASVDSDDTWRQRLPLSATDLKQVFSIEHSRRRVRRPKIDTQVEGLLRDTRSHRSNWSTGRQRWEARGAFVLNFPGIAEAGQGDPIGLG